MAVRSRAGIVMGVGLGGFMDGIVLHQMVQWHNMGSAKMPPTTGYCSPSAVSASSR